MNDPHVAALLYRVKHASMFNYEQARPRECDLAEFHIRIENDEATAKPKEHFATAEEARDVIEPYLRAWELDAALTHDSPDVLRFVYRSSEIIDRNPPPGAVGLGSADVLVLGEDLNIRMDLNEYPAPPVGLVVSAEVDAMYDRFSRYKAGQVPLGPMADFCRTVLEEGQRSAAAKKYGIDPLVLRTLADLAAEKGGRVHSRKWKGWSSEYTGQELAWMEAVVKKLIRRAAEVAHNPKANRPLITLGDLPPL
jgi:hypothetical protein